MFSKNNHCLNFSPNDRVGEPSSNQTRISQRRSNFITGTGIGALFLCFLSIMLFAVYVVGSIGTISTPQNNGSLSVPSHLN
ncbi:MAG: hypothetical protein QNJ54_32980 [Prochloraceae cyanobacterium]|nr:hypothetical protein [Prochloraceae cyanobacterium]